MDEILAMKKPPHIFLKEWRKKHKLGQEKLGERIGVDKPQVSNWESGKRRPNARNQALLADALGIEVVDLFRHPEDPSADELLRDEPPEVRKAAIEAIMTLKRLRGSA